MSSHHCLSAGPALVEICTEEPVARTSEDQAKRNCLVLRILACSVYRRSLRSPTTIWVGSGWSGATLGASLEHTSTLLVGHTVCLSIIFCLSSGWLSANRRCLVLCRGFSTTALDEVS